jgi:hypothetical protein
MQFAFFGCYGQSQQEQADYIADYEPAHLTVHD